MTSAVTSFQSCKQHVAMFKYHIVDVRVDMCHFCLLDTLCVGFIAQFTALIHVCCLH